jgi:hypothetical protein
VKTPGDEKAILAIERPHLSPRTYWWRSLLGFPPLLPILILTA